MLRLERKKAELEAKKRELKEGLPHLYGHKWYAWQRQFFESRNKMTLLTAANQIGKSTVQIWKMIHWCTAKSLWLELWPDSTPNLCWYLYPNTDTVSQEWRLKWKQWMPSGKFKDHPQYGWKVDAKRDESEVYSIRWNSGIEMHFKTYSQNVMDLQAGTVAYIAADEELPSELWGELDQRLSDTKGYFSSVFTATRGQQMWHRAMESKGSEELFPEAWKLQVSKYDCLTFDDGSPGRYTVEQIKAQEQRCTSKAQVLVRIYGKFASEDGLKYPTFDASRHYTKAIPVPHDWKLYGGVDVGSGGEKGHPAAIVFVAVSPDGRSGYVVDAWRGDGIETTAGDILEKFIEMRRNRPVNIQAYDWASKEFGMIATRAGEPFVQAKKGHELGESVINTLFKNDMLHLFDTDEIQKLGVELSSLRRDTDKTKAHDDLVDAMRYCLTQIPWDWSCLTGGLTDEQIEEKYKPRPLTKEELLEIEFNERRGIYKRGQRPDEGWQEFDEECDFWNSEYGNG